MIKLRDLNMKYLIYITTIIFLISCNSNHKEKEFLSNDSVNTTKIDTLKDNIKMIPINTPSGGFISYTSGFKL